MKLRPFFIAGIVLQGIILHCNAQSGTMVGSKHDFPLNENKWNYRGPDGVLLKGSSCLPCHDTALIAGQLPLWAHSKSGTNYRLNSELNDFPQQGNETVGYPDGISKSCLCCHDGTNALANFLRCTPGVYNMGNAKSDKSHVVSNQPVTLPICFNYNAAVAQKDHYLRDPSTAPSGLNGGTIEKDLLVNGKIQCTTCHEPHNLMNQVHLLRKNNTHGELCLTCHRI